ncbi:MAG: hypothetical protein J3R72DRAFT_495914 [Linnemannia gamsii]|nr:MAG: hypothetical protein J3R72DRAFT_495914 [Linnemannia gamsii]
MTANICLRLLLLVCIIANLVHAGPWTVHIDYTATEAEPGGFSMKAQTKVWVHIDGYISEDKHTMPFTSSLHPTIQEKRWCVDNDTWCWDFYDVDQKWWYGGIWVHDPKVRIYAQGTHREGMCKFKFHKSGSNWKHFRCEFQI